MSLIRSVLTCWCANIKLVQVIQVPVVQAYNKQTKASWFKKRKSLIFQIYFFIKFKLLHNKLTEKSFSIDYARNCYFQVSNKIVLFQTHYCFFGGCPSISLNRWFVSSDEQWKLQPEWAAGVTFLHSAGQPGSPEPRAAHQTPAGTGWPFWCSLSISFPLQVNGNSVSPPCRGNVLRKAGERPPSSSSSVSWP